MALDSSIFYFFNNAFLSYPLLAIVAVFFAKYFPYLVGFAALVFIVVRPDTIRAKARFMLTILSSVVVMVGVLIPIIRIFIERPRPFLTLPSVDLLYEPSYSFPSSHASIFFALATAMYFFNKKLGVAFAVSAVVISIARVMTGVHYPSDILTGAILGTVVAALFQKFFKFLLP